MKKSISIFLFLFLSMVLYGQIESEKSWSKSIQQKFNLIKNQNIDSILVYYSYSGPWSTIPDSCKNIYSMSILWKRNSQNYATEIFCNSKKCNDTIEISSKPISKFLSYLKDFELKEKHIRQHKFLPPIPTDGTWEQIIFMTSNTRLYLNLSEYQREDKIWKDFPWIKPTIETFDIIKSEIFKK